MHVDQCGQVPTSVESRIVRSRRSGFYTAFILLSLYACLLAYAAFRHSPTDSEVFHLPAGVSNLSLGRFDLYRVNPPLVRMVSATLPLSARIDVDWRAYSSDPHLRAEYPVGLDCMYANDTRILWLMTLARWSCIPFMVLGGWICFVWGRSLYGNASGLVALMLWCFLPYLLAHGFLIVPDAHAAALGVASYYFFWQWLRRSLLLNAFTMGLVLGVAELAKFTLLIFYPLWVATWLIYRLSDRNDRKWSLLVREGTGLTLAIAISILVINLGYAFEGSFRPVGTFRFQTMLMNGVNGMDSIPSEGGNRFAHSWVSAVPVPFPANYVQGIDSQLADFEQGLPSYLRGQWSNHGWWYFYLYALAIKVPLGMWFLAVLAACTSILDRGYSVSWRDEMVVLTPFFILLAFVSSQTGFSIHSRYVLPAFPFLFIWTSKVGRAFGMRVGTRYRAAIASMTVVLLTSSVASSLVVYPHSLSYFNELVGGSRNGYRHLAKSDSVWGQDLLYLRNWMMRHPDVNLEYLAHSGPFDPRLAGFQFELPPVGPTNSNHPGTLADERLGPKPGWYAINVCFLIEQSPLPAADGRGGWNSPTSTFPFDFSYFKRFNPVATAGYSIYIYHITLDEANRVRRELGLPKIDKEEHIAESGDRIDIENQISGR